MANCNGTEKVIQFGEGGFLRGFVDYFFYKLSEKGLFDGKIAVVQPIERGMIDLINAQDGKYNLFLRGIDKGEIVNERTEIDIISRGINPYTDFEEYMRLAENPDMRFIVSNTTEAGIEYLGTEKLTDAPAKSFPAKLTQLLYKRFQLGLKGFIVLSCELIDNNGKELLKCVEKYAELWELGEEFKTWLANDNHFCSTLVDRIVTGYPRDDIETFEKQIPYKDNLIDTAEIFHLWVIEGNFEDELPLQKAGFNVVWTDDVSPYKKQKVRILNGAHTSLVPYAMLKGLKTVGECMENEETLNFVKKCIYDEIIPTLDLPKEQLLSFADSVIERFKNPFVKHQLSAIALNSFDKFKVRVMPSILEYKNRFGEYPKALMQAFDAFCEFYKTDMANDSEENIAFMRSASKEEIWNKLSE